MPSNPRPLVSFGRILQVRAKSLADFELLNTGFRMIGKELEDIGHATRDRCAVVAAGHFYLFIFHTHFFHGIGPCTCIFWRHNRVLVSLDNHDRKICIFNFA